MARQTKYELVDMALNGRLEEYLRRLRSDNASYLDVVRDLDRHHNILVSDFVVRQWCDKLGIVKGDRARVA
jgi:hypothetical protein